MRFMLLSTAALSVLPQDIRAAGSEGQPEPVSVKNLIRRYEGIALSEAARREYAGKNNLKGPKTSDIQVPPPGIKILRLKNTFAHLQVMTAVKEEAAGSDNPDAQQMRGEEVPAQQTPESANVNAEALASQGEREPGGEDWK